MKCFKVLLTGNASNTGGYAKRLTAAGLKPAFGVDAPASALLLTGGGDVSPCLYGKTDRFTSDVDLMRDCTELFLIRKYLSENKPVFGICRGMQILNVYFGGTLKTKLVNAEFHSRGKSKIDKKHVNKSINGTFCKKLYGEFFISNSAHHQVIEKRADYFTVSARAIDGEIEAIEGKNVYAVQFHPERMLGADTADGGRFFDFMREVISRSVFQ